MFYRRYKYVLVVGTTTFHKQDDNVFVVGTTTFHKQDDNTFLKICTKKIVRGIFWYQFLPHTNFFKHYIFIIKNS